MTQMGFPWKPRNTPTTTTTTVCSSSIGGSTTSISVPNNRSCTTTTTTTSSTQCSCSLAKLVMRKLKKQSRLLRTANRQSSRLKCRYDPLSYSLNFDTSGCGSLIDEDYYSRFYAFSSRFVANGSGTTSCPRLIVTTTH